MKQDSWLRPAPDAAMKELRRAARSLFRVVYDVDPAVTRRWVVPEGRDVEDGAWHLTFTSLSRDIRGVTMGGTLAQCYVTAIDVLADKMMRQWEDDYDEGADEWLWMRVRENKR